MFFFCFYMEHKKCPPSCSLWNSVMPCGLQRAPRAFQSLKGLNLKVFSQHGMSIEHHRIRLRGAFYGFMNISVPEKVISRLRTIVRVKVVLNRIGRSWSTYLRNGFWVQTFNRKCFCTDQLYDKLYQLYDKLCEVKNYEKGRVWL